MGLEAMVVECGKRLAKMSTKGLPGDLKSSLRSLAPRSCGILSPALPTRRY